jgi:predicted nucleic acid-binding protein
MDSLQLASAIHLNCELFVSNDKRLLSIREIKVIILD